MNQAIYFNLRDVDRQVSAAEGQSTQDPMVLKDLYLRRLALLSHGTFAQQDPFTGELRHWADYGTEESDFDLAGRKGMWQEAISTIWLLLYGSTGPDSNPRIRVEIPIDDTEEQYLEGLLHRLLDTYTIEVGNATARGETTEGRGMGYVEDRREALEER